MSKEWIFYPCRVDEKSASIFYDHGVRENIDQIAPPCLLKVQIIFKHPRPDGLSSREEFESLCALEDELQSIAEQHGGLYVGRVTVGGYRKLYVFVSGSEADWTAKLQSAGERHGYDLQFILKPDPARDGYWQELFPNADNWQVIEDLRVLEVLQKHGDNGASRRLVDHWACFSESHSAELYSEWLLQQGYKLKDRKNQKINGSFCIQFTHEGTCLLPDITSRTVVLNRKAAELGGEYDGWETQVCPSSDPE